MEYKPLEFARIIGEPMDPKKPYPDIISECCEIDTADPDEYVYYFDVLADTDEVYEITATGTVTSSAVTPDTPALFNFTDISSPEYYVKITDLAKAKERTLARKVATINRAMNGYEIRYLVSVADAAIRAGNNEGLRSGSTWFSFQNLIYMIDMVKDYGDNYSLVCGSTIDRDILLWDWADNKYSNLAEALSKLGINIIRVKGTVSTNGGAQIGIINPNQAYLVAKSTTIGKPFLFVRKKLSDIELLGGAIKQNGEAPERLVFVSPNPVMASGGSTRYLAVGVTGFEEVVMACTNPYALAKFNRA